MGEAGVGPAMMKSIHQQSAPVKFTLNLEDPIGIRSANSSGKVAMITLPPYFDVRSRDRVRAAFDEMAGDEAKGDNPVFSLGFYRNKAILQLKITDNNKLSIAEVEIPESVNKKFGKMIEGLNKTILMEANRSFKETNRSILRTAIDIKLRTGTETNNPKDLFALSDKGYVPIFTNGGW
jgi:hypothetical protein